MDIESLKNKLRTSSSINEISSAVNKLSFNLAEKTPFEKNVLTFKSSQGVNCSVNIQCEQPLFRLSLKIYLYLKLEGLVGSSLINSGVLSHFMALKTIFVEIEALCPQLKSFQDIPSSVFDKIIYSHTGLNKTLYTKFQKLLEVHFFASDFLPDFLLFDIDKIIGLQSYIALKNRALNEIQEKSNEIGSNRIPCRLEDMKTLIQESMKIIENFSSDGNLATKLYKKAKYISSESQENHKGIRRQTKILHNQHSVKKTQNTCDSKKKDSQYIAVYHALKELQQANYDAKEPDLIKLLKEVSETEEPYRYKKGNSKKGRYRTLKKPLLRLLNINRRLESSCIAVILFTTGMRSSELKRLKRFPEITNDENLNLSRLIYKTAQTEQGEILSMPIPEITKKALNVLSKISQLSDNEKEGDLIVGSIYSLLDSQMSQVSIRDKLIYLCKHVGIPNIITSHQFRHTMAFLISYSNQKDGLELAKTFLGHKSTEMTLKYMGHYNGIFKDTLRLMSQKNTKAIISEINKQTIDGKKIYGQKGERILQKHQFIGSYAENVTDILDSKLIELAKKGTLKIIQTPVSICIIDTDEDQCELEPLAIKTPNEQLDIDLYSNIDTSLKKRLETNTYFIENGGFDSLKSSIKKQENKEKKTTCLD